MNTYGARMNIYICTKKHSLKIWWQNAKLTFYSTIFFIYTCQLQDSLGSCINHWPLQSTEFFSCTWNCLFLPPPFCWCHPFYLFTNNHTISYFSASFSLINLQISFPIVFPRLIFSLFHALTMSQLCYLKSIIINSFFLILKASHFQEYFTKMKVFEKEETP